MAFTLEMYPISYIARYNPQTKSWEEEWIGWISLQSKGLSRVFSSTTVQRHQFFGILPSLQSSSQNCT